MRIRIDRRTSSLDPDARVLLDGVARSIDERLSPGDAADTELGVRLDQRDDGWFEADLELTLPGLADDGSGQTILGHALGLESTAALADASTQLTDEVDRFRWQVEPSLRAREGAREAGVPERGDRGLDVRPGDGPHDAFRRRVVAIAAPGLLRNATHEVAARQLLGDLDPGWVDPMEMVDEVMAEQLPTMYAGDDLHRVLHDLVVRLVGRIDQAVREQAEAAGRDLSTDTTVDPRAPGRIAQDLGEDVVDWWQEDAGDGRFEDRLAEEAAEVSGERAGSPEALSADREGRRRLLEALLREPPMQRHLFALHVLDDWSLATVAANAGRSETEVYSRIREIARSLALSLKAAEGDARVGPDDAIARYRALGEVLRHRHAAEARAAERPVFPPVVVQGDEDHVL